MTYVLPVPTPPSLPVSGGDTLFPVRRVFCVGRNYGDHAREMGADPTREPPFFFLKPADAVFAPQQRAASGDARPAVPYPPQTADLHHEVELVVALRQDGDLADQIWTVPEIIAHLSRSVILRPGDLIFTGTPAGVGALSRGSTVTAGIDGVAELSFTIE